MESFYFAPSLPLENSSLAFTYFPSKILSFKTHLPLGISNDLPWGGVGMDFFWNCTINDMFAVRRVFVAANGYRVYVSVDVLCNIIFMQQCHKF